MDARPYVAEKGTTIALEIQKDVHWYRPPPISDRLSVQRGSFLIGPLASDSHCTLPLVANGDRAWLGIRIDQIGGAGRPIRAETEVAVFRVRRGIKPETRRWLEDRAGLDQDTIYPTPWHRPFLEDFCRSYGRDRPLD